MALITLAATRPEDCEAVSRILAAAYGRLLLPDYPAETLAVIVPLISRARPELVSSGTYYAAIDNGTMVAVGGWTRQAPGSNAIEKGVGHIRHVATDPAHLRKGAARAIMQQCFVDARVAGLSRMECLSTRTARPFYVSCGFEPLGERLVMVAGHPFESVAMRLDLKPA